MSNRPTVKDVAREAGVSVTTVDRALNGRAVVREDTMRRIAEAAHKVGYHARGLINHRLNTVAPEMTFGFILLKEKHEFYQQFARELEAAVAARTDVRGRAIIRYATSQTPEHFAEHIATLGANVDAIASVAVNHQKLSNVVEDLREKGVLTYSLLNDFAQGVRRNYLGLNNMKVGRVAAWTLTRGACNPGPLAIFVGGNRWHGHDLREVGFRSFVRENTDGFRVLDTIVNLEARQVTYEAVHDLIDRYPELSGIYVSGGGMEGAIAAVREACQPGQLPLVVNELTSESRAALQDGYLTTVISTPLQQLCHDLVNMMVNDRNHQSDPTFGQHFLEPRLIVPDML